MLGTILIPRDTVVNKTRRKKTLSYSLILEWQTDNKQVIKIQSMTDGDKWYSKTQSREGEWKCRGTRFYMVMVVVK